MSNFWKTVEIPVINCENNLILNQSQIILSTGVVVTQVPTFSNNWYKTLCCGCNFVNSR